MLYLRQVYLCEDGGNCEHQHTQNGIGYRHITTAVAEQELAYGKRGEERAQAVERLREVQAAGGCLAVAQLGDVGVGSRLQEGQAAADDEQRPKEGVERACLGTGDEQQGTQTEQKQSEHHASPIAETVDE